MLPAVLTRYEKASGVLWAALEFLLYAYVLVLTARMVGEMCAYGVAVFFQNPLNWIEFVNQATFMLVFALRIAQEVRFNPVSTLFQPRFNPVSTPF